MATSIQTHGGASEFINDLDLIAILCLSHSVVTAEPALFPSIQRIVDGWMADLDGYGPGTIDLKLDQIDWNSETESELRRLWTLVLAAAASDDLAKTLVRKCPIPGVNLERFNGSLVPGAVAKLKRLTASQASSPG